MGAPRGERRVEWAELRDGSWVGGAARIFRPGQNPPQPGDAPLTRSPGSQAHPRQGISRPRNSWPWKNRGDPAEPQRRKLCGIFERMGPVRLTCTSMQDPSPTKLPCHATPRSSLCPGRLGSWARGAGYRRNIAAKHGFRKTRRSPDARQASPPFPKSPRMSKIPACQESRKVGRAYIGIAQRNRDGARKGKARRARDWHWGGHWWAARSWRSWRGIAVLRHRRRTVDGGRRSGCFVMPRRAGGQG